MENNEEKRRQRKRLIDELITKEDLINFCNENGRLPNTGRNSIEEQRLYQFFKYHRGEPDIEELRNKFKQKRTSDESLLSISKFCEEHGRMPYYSKHSKEERNLYMIWYNNRNEPEYVKLKEKYDIDVESQVISFCEKYGRLPKFSDKDKMEKKLRNYWNCHMKDNPKFSEFNRKYYQKIEKITKEILIDFIRNNKRLPRNVKEESRLLYFLKQNVNDKDIINIINELNIQQQEYEVTSFDDFKMFCEKIHRLPTHSSTDKEEHKMYRFMLRHKTKPEVIEIKKSFGKIKKKQHVLIDFLTLHIEDLSMMDKSELLQIGMLGDLPKEEHRKLMEFPKGEEKVGFIKEMIERLKNSKENQEKETFSEFLNEDVDESNKTSASKEETEFEKELHKGLEIIENSKSYNLEKQISDLFGGLDALGNFKYSDFTSEEAIDYIVSFEIQKLWNIVICNPTKAMKLVEEQMLQRGSSEFFGKVINEFLRQYNEVINFRIPDGYSFPFQPTLMQKLTAFMILEKEQAANWSETGSGKTLSGVLSSRAIDSRITFVIAVNSTINNWTDDAIKRAYPDSKIYRKSNITDTTILDRNFHNYVVVNYEEFQNSNKFLNKWKPFLINNKVDFVILDEIQKVKANSRDSMTNRRIVIENLLQEIDKKHGRDLEKDGRKVPILALSATPVINSVNEGLSIISLLRGIDYTSKRNTRKSALACHFDIVKMGLRLIEESPAIERLITFPIKRDVKDISGINVEGNKNFLVAIDICGCLIKIGECIRRGYLQPGIPTVIYTELVTDVIDPIIGFLQANNFRVGEFTGRNESTREIIKKGFIAGKYDVLIASKPITTGVNGLQKVCNRIIPIVLPWTYAEYHQLIGRLNRKGTIFDEVQVIIPNIEYTNSNNEVWSLDNNRLARIHYKQILADVIMTGNIPDDIITTEQAYKLAKDKFITFINNEGSSEKSREIPAQAAELKPTPPKSRPEGQGNQRDYFSEFQGINQKISTSTCDGVFSKIFKSKEDWEKYHDLREKAMGSKQNQPLYTIVRDHLKSKKHKTLGDMGCGMNQLKTILPENYEVISVDMFAADETVKVCNLMDTSKIIPNESLDVAVYCLSLWSRDWRGILKDAYRILDYDGKIIIVEPVSSLSKSIDKVRQTLSENGFINISVIKDGEDKFYYMTASK